MNQATSMAPDPRDTVGKGMLVVLLWNVLHIAVGIATMPIGYGVFALAFFGGVELMYVAPLAVLAWRMGRRRRMKGILYMWLIGVVLTVVLLMVIYSMLRGLRF